ncbi:MAG TPA: AAA family ATPase [Turneriella sp.]|nr:AAA family ATPase [Turneriella sp.]
MLDIAGVSVPEAEVSPTEKNLVFHQELILTETTQANLRKILYPLLEGQNLLLVGDAGVGKNALIYYINRIRGLPTVRFSFNQDTLPEDLSGSFRVLPSGFQWNNGPLAEALEKGYTFVADEMNLASPEILKRFISVFDRRRLALLEKDGSDIHASDRFSFVATQNPARGFEGRKNLPESIARHFTTIYLDHYPEHEEKEILRGLYPAEYGAIADIVVKVQRVLETAIWKNELAKEDLEHYHFNLRTAQRFMNRALVASVADANTPVFRDLLFTFYVEVFRLEADRENALKIIAQVLTYDWAQLKGDYEISRVSTAHGAYNNQVDLRGEDKKLLSQLYFPLTSTRQTILEKMHASLTANDNLLLEGDDAARILELCHRYCDAYQKNQRVTEVFLSRGMHTSDIIGALRPHLHGGIGSGAGMDAIGAPAMLHGGIGSGAGMDAIGAPPERQRVKWIDGPLTAALRRGDLIILENIDAAGSELVEKLNMLLDHAGRLALPPEAEGESILKKEGNCRIIAIKRTRRSRNQQTISRALRNRFFNMYVPVVEAQSEVQEIVALALDNEFGEDASPLRKSFVLKLALFHGKADDAAREKKVGASLAESIRYREENLLRLLGHVGHAIVPSQRERGLGGEGAEEILKRGVDIYYAGILSDAEERLFIRRLFERIFADMPWEDMFTTLSEGKKKILSKGKKRNKEINPPDWDKAKHFREANTGKAQKRLSGEDLKKGIRIDTPETGGNTKEGPDAWYGSDTQGNGGQGEPAGGGGAWGYRNEALFEAFLKKYKPKWEYHMGYSLADFYDVFGKMLSELQMDLENALDAEPEIERRLLSEGHRVDARRYITYQAYAGNDRIFDHTRIRHVENKLKGVEFIFMLAKGRRMFNFKAALSAVVALQSCAEILFDRKIPIKVFGYSDFDNMKRAIDINRYLATEGESPSHEEKVALFDSMTDHWNGDTVDESQVLRHAAQEFSPEATTKFVVMVSDFRGHRARAELQKEILSHQSQDLKNLGEEYERQNIHVLAVQTGTRSIAEHLFKESLWIHEETFASAPILLAEGNDFEIPPRGGVKPSHLAKGHLFASGRIR